MILPPATLGMLGGGQLGRFFVLAAKEMGYRVIVLDPDASSPAGRMADEHLVADYQDQDALEHMARECAAITTEFENVPAETLDLLSHSVPVRPAAACVAIAQNRIREKTFLRDHGFPVGKFEVITSVTDLERAAVDLFPAVLKVARFGYDGKGQARVANHVEAYAAWHKFGSEACVLEAMLPLDAEISVVLARSHEGEVRCYPVAENIHRNGILDVSIAPARIDENLCREAETIAAKIAPDLGYVGVMAVEFFVSGGKLLVNEMAPRPHNSGHYTLDACMTSQFEQQVRALCGLPLGDVCQHSAAVMVNLLGDVWFTQDHGVSTPDWQKLLSESGLKLRQYDKHEARHGRKMGHFTVVDAQLANAVEVALRARAAIGITD